MSMDFTEQEIEHLLEKNQFRNSEENLERLPIQKEASVMNSVRQGDYNALRDGIQNLSDLSVNFGSATRSRSKLFEYYTAAWISGCTRTAIDGGMRPDDAYDLSDVMLGELENASSPEDISKIFQIAPYIFAKAVANARKSSSSYVVEQCRNYIARHIFQKIEVEDVAAYVGLNAKYLSRLFKKEEHISIHQYIQREKIEKACNLLRYSDRPVSAIAQYMGFATQSNFGVVFRKWKGMTPGEYRNRFHLDNYSFHE